MNVPAAKASQRNVSCSSKANQTLCPNVNVKQLLQAWSTNINIANTLQSTWIWKKTNKQTKTHTQTHTQNKTKQATNSKSTVLIPGAAKVRPRSRGGRRSKQATAKVQNRHHKITLTNGIAKPPSQNHSHKRYRKIDLTNAIAKSPSQNHSYKHYNVSQNRNRKIALTNVIANLRSKIALTNAIAKMASQNRYVSQNANSKLLSSKRYHNMLTQSLPSKRHHKMLITTMLTITDRWRTKMIRIRHRVYLAQPKIYTCIYVHTST